MQQTIEDIRKNISNMYCYLTSNKYLSFFKEERNRPTSANSIELAHQLNASMQKTRTLLNAFSNSIEDTEVCMKNLWFALCKEKAPRKERKKDKEII